MICAYEFVWWDHNVINHASDDKTDWMYSLQPNINMIAYLGAYCINHTLNMVD